MHGVCPGQTLPDVAFALGTMLRMVPTPVGLGSAPCAVQVPNGLEQMLCMTLSPSFRGKHRVVWCLLCQSGICTACPWLDCVSSRNHSHYSGIHASCAHFCCTVCGWAPCAACVLGPIHRAGLACCVRIEGLFTIQ